MQGDYMADGNRVSERFGLAQYLDLVDHEGTIAELERRIERLEQDHSETTAQRDSYRLWFALVLEQLIKYYADARKQSRYRRAA
jgi:hypothetical protein